MLASHVGGDSNEILECPDSDDHDVEEDKEPTSGAYGQKEEEFETGLLVR